MPISNSTGWAYCVFIIFCLFSLEPETQSSQEIESFRRITQIILIFLVQQVMYLRINGYSFEYIIAGSDMQIINCGHFCILFHFFPVDVIITQIYVKSRDRMNTYIERHFTDRFHSQQIFLCFAVPIAVSIFS